MMSVNKSILFVVLVTAIGIGITITPNVYARSLSNSQRYNDGFNDGSQAAISDRNNGNQFNPACDPTGAHTSDGQHTVTYCTGWANGYTSAWNGNSGSPSSRSDNSGQGGFPQNGNDGQDSSGSGLLGKVENFCHNHSGICSAVGGAIEHSLIGAIGLG
jgi:hypothetical protein